MTEFQRTRLSGLLNDYAGKVDVYVRTTEAPYGDKINDIHDAHEAIIKYVDKLIEKAKDGREG